MPAPPGFCFVHAADLHLDTPLRGLATAAPGVAEVLRDASLHAFDAVVATALERRSAFVVVAGDVYDGAERGLRAQLRFRDGLARLGAAGTAAFVVHGNHDPVESGWSAITAWPEGTTVFPAATAHRGLAPVVPVLARGEVLATVQGLSYATRATSENLALRLLRPAPAGSGREPFHVGVLHCNVAGAPGGHADYSPCTLADLRATRLDYLALGHVHQRAVLARGSGPGDPWVVYPGDTQAHSWRAGERGAKGVYVVQVEDGRVAELEFAACDAVRFEELDAAIDGAEDLGALADQLGRAAEAASVAAGARAVVLRGELTGSGPLHEQLARPRVVEELLGHLREDAGASAPLRWWDSLRDSTRPSADTAALAGRGDFAADLIELGRDAAAGGELAAELVERLTAALPRGLARRARELLEDPGRRDDVLARATRRALDALAGEVAS